MSRKRSAEAGLCSQLGGSDDFWGKGHILGQTGSAWSFWASLARVTIRSLGLCWEAVFEAVGARRWWWWWCWGCGREGGGTSWGIRLRSLVNSVCNLRECDRWLVPCGGGSAARWWVNLQPRLTFDSSGVACSWGCCLDGGGGGGSVWCAVAGHEMSTHSIIGRLHKCISKQSSDNTPPPPHLPSAHPQSGDKLISCITSQHWLSLHWGDHAFFFHPSSFTFPV